MTNSGIIDVDVGPLIPGISQPTLNTELILTPSSPDVLSVSNHTRSTPVDASLDESRNLLTLGVSDSTLYDLGLVDTVDGAWQDDESSNLCLLVGFNNGEIDASVECSVG